MDDEIQDPVTMGIRQIEALIRAGHIGTAEIAFELTASGMAPYADLSQIARLRQLATALEVDGSFLDGYPVGEIETGHPSRFGQH